MVLILGSLAIFLALSNVYLILRLRALRKKPAPTLEAAQLMHDLTVNGGALLQVRVLDPEGLFLMRGGR